MSIMSGASFHIIAISFGVYLFVNFFENLIHYNIGKSSNKATQLELPNKNDFIKIVVVMCTFALLKGLLTNFFNNYI